ncbi:WD40 repeat domain-containing protein [Caldimonas sp. KR1-144]|uniref:WD40 repeat domain-containing protein n=1 Tax=Caldimonas sp. KR1-144 TaxID=3400911 RepID=UPI003C104BA9
MHTKFPTHCALAALLALLCACGGGSSIGSDEFLPTRPDGSSTGGFDALMAVSAEAPGGHCPAGGSRIDAGLDLDRDGSLSSNEVGSTQYVCNGLAGSAGGAGLNALARLRDEPAGAHCAAGGKAIDVGQDRNADGVLNADEADSTGYLCNASAGTDGANGSPGAGGANGANGLNTLLASLDEPPGAHCPYGGRRIDTGVDLDSDGALGATEVDATSYLCNGAPGASFGWITLTDATQPVLAQAHTGYLATSDAGQIVVRLPAQPSVGDVVRVSGIGTGGWRIEQNDGQAVYTAPLGGVAGRHWTLRNAPAQRVQDVASSANGRILATAHYDASVYRSTDGGITWSQIRASRGLPDFDGCAMVSSADGRKLAVASSIGVFTWTEGDPDWTLSLPGGAKAIGASADARTLVILDFNGDLHLSFDGGSGWASPVSFGAMGPASIACSSDCRAIVVAASGSPIWQSPDYGQTWQATGPTRWWTDVASSADGQRLVATAHMGGGIYGSFDGGAQWSLLRSQPQAFAAAMSADGRKLMALGRDRHDVSIDGAATWTSLTFDFQGYPQLAWSADGSRAIVGSEQGTYTSIASTTPGPAGSISGQQFDAITLQYVGNGMFNVLSHEGSLKTE